LICWTNLKPIINIEVDGSATCGSSKKKKEVDAVEHKTNEKKHGTFRDHEKCRKQRVSTTGVEIRIPKKLVLNNHCEERKEPSFVC
jgi:hypothetical protein